MSERYERVFTGEENLYLDKAPVVIRASALLKDTQTGKLVAQLKLQNVSDQKISYVKIAITSFDAIKNPLSEAQVFEYLDLSVGNMEEFGAKTPIRIPNASARSFTVGVTHVGFADGSVWIDEKGVWDSAADGSNIVKKIEAEIVYKKAKKLLASQCENDVIRAKDLLISIQSQKDVLHEISLCEGKIERFKTDRKREEIKQAEKEKAAKKAKKVVGITIMAGILFSLVGYFVIYPWASLRSGDFAVYINMYSVEEFNVPESITSIADYAFYDCESLKKVTIPESVTSIADYAFEGCRNLNSVTIADSVTRIGTGAFYSCESLKEVTIPEGVTHIGAKVFYGCKNLTSVTIPNSVISFGSYAFYGCERAITITFNGTKSQWKSLMQFAPRGSTVLCTDGTVE